MYIYSDALNQMFQCGEYQMLRGSILDFNGLEIPCIDQVVLTLSERDSSQNDTYTLRIPCLLAGNGVYDFNIMANKSRVNTTASVKPIPDADVAKYDYDGE